MQVRNTPYPVNSKFKSTLSLVERNSYVALRPGEGIVFKEPCLVTLIKQLN